MNGVKARRFVWSDPEVQDLATNFVAVADELHALRTGETREAKFFQGVFQQKERHPGHQGVFVATPGGRLLGSSTCSTADSMATVLRRSLEAWASLSDAERFEPESPLLAPWGRGRPEDDYPEQGLVLRVTARDLPEAGLDAERSPRWHRYFLWFNRDEMLSMLPPRLERNQTQTIPRRLAVRLATLALLDKGLVDGFTHPFGDADVERAELNLTVAEVTLSRVRLEISGSTATRTRDAPAFYGGMPKYERVPKHRGVRTEIIGDAVFDRASNRFERFDLVAVGARFGGAYVGRPPDDWSERPIGFSFRMGDGTPTERIAPEFPERYDWIGSR